MVAAIFSQAKAGSKCASDHCPLITSFRFKLSSNNKRILTNIGPEKTTIVIKAASLIPVF
jgi:hypothetical protein